MSFRVKRRGARNLLFPGQRSTSPRGVQLSTGPLAAKTKELLGLVASAVLRCDDCITYHLVRSAEEGWTREEVIDALNVALIVGGSITIPHVRRAFARMREINGLKPNE